ncbi:MAG: winged helix-turn-helix domain-containing protein [Candidatus Thorarchaeota archaeon]
MDYNANFYKHLRKAGILLDERNKDRTVAKPKGAISRTIDKSQNNVVRVLLERSRGKGTRIKILQALVGGGPMNCYQLSQRLKFSWKSINHHLKILTRVGCIETVKLFKDSNYYNITEFGKSMIHMKALVDFDQAKTCPPQ